MTKVVDDTWHRRGQNLWYAAAVILFSSDMSSANGMDAAAATSPMRELVDSFAARESAPRHLLDGGRRTEVRGTVAKASVAVATHSNPRPTATARPRAPDDAMCEDTVQYCRNVYR